MRECLRGVLVCCRAYVLCAGALEVLFFDDCLLLSA
jgi:hypothetical protein